MIYPLSVAGLKTGKSFKLIEGFVEGNTQTFGTRNKEYF
jgi:hypothetical protein